MSVNSCLVVYLWFILLYYYSIILIQDMARQCKTATTVHRAKSYEKQTTMFEACIDMFKLYIKITGKKKR